MSEAAAVSQGAERVRWLQSAAWLPVPLLVAAMLALRMLDLRASWDSPYLLLAFNIVFATSISLVIAYLAALSFLVRSTLGSLMLGCGALAWGAGGLVAAAAGGWDPNVVVTIHNSCACLSATCHLAGVALSLRPARAIDAARMWLPAAYGTALGVVGLVAVAAVRGWMPTFFVQGLGGTPLRQLVLALAVAMFALAAVLVQAKIRRDAARFPYWYCLALALVAAGLFGVMLESVHGSALSWLGRAAQFLSGAYMLVAAHASVRESRAWGVPLEAALQDSESRYEALFASSLDAILVTADGGQIVTANPAARALFGMSEDDFRQAGRAALVDPADTRLAAIAEQQPGAASVCAKLRWMRKDGTRFEGEFSSIPIGNGRTFDIIRDVTDRKRAEEALRAFERESALRAGEAKFRALIEESLDIILVLDADRTVRFWSPGATAALGFAEAEVLGRPFDLVHREDKLDATRALRRVLSAPAATARVTCRFRHKDGSWRVVESVVRNLLHDPAVQGVVVNSRDVTEQRLLEEHSWQAQKLESIGRLAGGVAHDFNNLLVVILSCSDALKLDLEAGLRANPEDIEHIRLAGERARDLTRQLLAFARKQLIAPVPLDLGDVVRSSEKLLRRVLGEDVELAVRVEPHLWSIVCDAGQIEQVLLNLAINSRDAMPRGGVLTIESRNAEIGPAEAAQWPDLRPGEWVHLRVRDTGTGMSPRALAHVFEPFFTTKERGKGTGLGLAMVHGIVTQSGGRIRVSSEPGQGTTFDICFPRSLQGTVSHGAPTPAPAARSAGTETVFVVEDDAQVREVTVRSLRAAGYRVLAAGNGREAFDVAARHQDGVALLVTDVIMPELDGRAVADGLRARYPDLRVLFVSGYTDDAIARHGVLESGVELLPKPFTPTSLLRRVRAVLDGR
jgi:two-component system, cell cycle sensor histidine kinase and response regulator CckA